MTWPPPEPLIPSPILPCAVCGAPSTNGLDCESPHGEGGAKVEVFGACDAHLNDVADHLLRTRIDAPPLARAAALDAVDVWDQRLRAEREG